MIRDFITKLHVFKSLVITWKTQLKGVGHIQKEEYRLLTNRTASHCLQIVKFISIMRRLWSLLTYDFLGLRSRWIGREEARFRCLAINGFDTLQFFFRNNAGGSFGPRNQVAICQHSGHPLCRRLLSGQIHSVCNVCPCPVQGTLHNHRNHAVEETANKWAHSSDQPCTREPSQWPIVGHHSAFPTKIPRLAQTTRHSLAIPDESNKGMLQVSNELANGYNSGASICPRNLHPHAWAYHHGGDPTIWSLCKWITH